MNKELNGFPSTKNYDIVCILLFSRWFSFLAAWCNVDMCMMMFGVSECHAYPFPLVLYASHMQLVSLQEPLTLSLSLPLLSLSPSLSFPYSLSPLLSVFEGATTLAKTLSETWWKHVTRMLTACHRQQTLAQYCQWHLVRMLVTGFHHISNNVSDCFYPKWSQP